MVSMFKGSGNIEIGDYRMLFISRYLKDTQEEIRYYLGQYSNMCTVLL